MHIYMNIHMYIYIYMYEKWKCQLLSRVQFSATPWTVALQTPLFMGLSRQEYWSGLPFPSPGDRPDPGIKPASPSLQADALPSELYQGSPGGYNHKIITTIKAINIHITAKIFSYSLYHHPLYCFCVVRTLNIRSMLLEHSFYMYKTALLTIHLAQLRLVLCDHHLPRNPPYSPGSHNSILCF